jgi:hypothetical protein
LKVDLFPIYAQYSTSPDLPRNNSKAQFFYSERPRKPRSFKAGMNGPTLWGVMGWVLRPLTSVLLKRTM